MNNKAQEIQDQIFRKMSAEKKIKLASSFWHFAKQVAGTDRIYSNLDGIRNYIKKSR